MISSALAVADYSLMQHCFLDALVAHWFCFDASDFRVNARSNGNCKSRGLSPRTRDEGAEHDIKSSQGLMLIVLRAHLLWVDGTKIRENVLFVEILFKVYHGLDLASSKRLLYSICLLYNCLSWFVPPRMDSHCRFQSPCSGAAAQSTETSPMRQDRAWHFPSCCPFPN